MATTLAHDRIDPARLLGEFIAGLDGDGAVASFTGLARPADRQGAAVARLRLDHYAGVTEASIEAIAAAARTRFPVSELCIVHRCGSIAPGEAIVFVAAAARHRRAAIEAADYLMDRLKTEAVLWKCEEGPDGKRWIEPDGDDHAARARWG
ncbi:MAG: molybdenum cofactor biosynthesis protein MoaE [Sphingomonadales bacterium]|nr:molybdenum cofactor biosynthesis protein MoaE [Sphingomonadales bacterium]